MKTVNIWLKETSEPIVYKDVINTYTKGCLFCVQCSDDTVTKYPVADIFCIFEDYGTHVRSDR